MIGKLGIDHLTIYLDNGEYLAILDDQTIGEIVRSLLEYVATAERPNQESWDASKIMAYRMLEASVDGEAIKKGFDRRKFSSRTNGKLGGRPKKNTLDEIHDESPALNQNAGQGSTYSRPIPIARPMPQWKPTEFTNPALNYDQRKYKEEDFADFFEDLSGGTQSSNTEQK